jgi:hypothetical protein
MRAAVPPAQEELDDASMRRLRDLTRTLVAANAGAEEEQARLVAIGQGSLCPPEET